MRRFLCILLLSLGSFAAHSQVDSLQLGGLLKEYVAALDPHSLPEKYGEVDFIISACPTEATRLFTLNYLFDYFSTSKNMDDENVAVYLVDKYNMTSLPAKFFADANRNCLLGCRAPEFDGTVASGLGHYHILYFFDHTCSKCKLEGARLDAYMENEYPYNTRLSRIDAATLSDSTILNYNVLSTPKIYLLDPQGVIIGRKLDVDALRKLQIAYNPYTQNEDYERLCKALFDGGFQEFDTVCESIKELTQSADPMNEIVAKRMIVSVQNYLLGDFRGEARNAHSKLISDVIMPLGEEFWSSEKDSVEVVLPAKLFEDLYARTPVGSKLPRLRIVDREGRPKNLRRIRDAYLLLGDSKCSACHEEAAQLEGTGAKVVVVFVDKQVPSVEAALEEAFDLSRFPFALYINNKGRVAQKYL